MKFINLKTVTVWLVAMALGLAPVASLAFNHGSVLGLGGVTPVGQWEADNHESRYDVTLCGDGTQLCALLVWIRPQNLNERNQQYLNTYVVFEAMRYRPALWKGDINVYGTTYGGSVRIINQNKLLLTGCFFILCETFELDRVKNPDGSEV